jgi:hypothetical protein
MSNIHGARAALTLLADIADPKAIDATERTLRVLVEHPPDDDPAGSEPFRDALVELRIAQQTCDPDFATDRERAVTAA